MTSARRPIVCALAALATAVLLGASAAHAQSISGVAAVKNAGNNPDNFQDDTFVSFQRTTTLAVTANTGTVVRTRYAEVVGADVGTFSSTTNTQATDYNINFNVTAPGAYDLVITTSLNGAFTSVDDGDGPGTADMTAVAGTHTGGTLSGTLSLTDPGGPVSSGNTGFFRSSSATIQGTSNGGAVAHTLRFTWSASCSSSNGFLTGGDECAVRLGLPITYSGETAGDYPGAGARVQGNDGHFVTVSLVSLCGDSTVQGTRGEQCDLGTGVNGTPGTCCTSSCQLVANGVTCRASVGVCDLTETCTGSSPTCPADGKSTALCRGTAGVCDVAESCNGVGNDCPTDMFASGATLCRAAVGLCDAPENCTGSGPNCPADVNRPNGFPCRAAAGTCDVAEVCTGASNLCPADILVPLGTPCRGSAGVCDVAETCNGVSPACPADAVQPSSAVCRPSAGVCDQVENCDGSGVNCPPDVFLGSTSGSFVCRAAAGVCDVPDVCNGSGPACPPDAKSTAQCRGSAGVCDVAESCDGVNNACPADAFVPSSTVCRPAGPPCDLAESCTGSGAACPADTGLPDTDSDTICDANDNCQSIPNTSQANNDSDPFGDACDPCTNIAPTVQSKAKLTLTKLLAPANDDKLAFSSYFTGMPNAPTINPVANGARFLIVDDTGAIPVDITIPGGAYNAVTKVGWKVNGSGTSWTYKNAGTSVPLVNGITKVQVKTYGSTPGKVKTQVKGKNGSYPVNPANLPIVGTIVIDVPFASTGQCGEAMFPLAPPAKPSCVAVSGGKTIKCK